MKGQCIYCKENKPLNREHAFPDSLRQQNTPGWIIDNHLCKKCNSDLGKLDVVLTQRSGIAFLFDLIQREHERENKSVYASPYHKMNSGVKPIRMLFPNPVYDDLIVLHEPYSMNMNHQVNHFGMNALQPQMILTQCRDGQTYREVIEENHRKFHDKSLRNDNWYIQDREDDVYCLFGNTYIFPPEAAHRYSNRFDELKSKFMTDYSHTRYVLRVIFPEEGRGKQKFFDFFHKIQDATKTVIPEDKNLPREVFRTTIAGIMDNNAELLFYRAIAKLAFHCFLYHHHNYTGHETMFNPIKNFISRGSGIPSKFVRSVVAHENIKNFVYKDTEHQHFFGFFINDKNIGCQVDLFSGLMIDTFSYNIVLAGDPDKKCSISDSIEPSSFFVHPKSPLKKKIVLVKQRVIPGSEVGIVRPYKISDLLWLRK